MVIKNLENKIRLVGIICTAFLVGCVIISLSSIWTARTMVSDAQKKVYVLDGNVPILVNRTTMDETLDMEAKSHVEMFHHYFFTLPPDDNVGLNAFWSVRAKRFAAGSTQKTNGLCAMREGQSRQKNGLRLMR